MPRKVEPGDITAILDDDRLKPLQRARRIQKMFPQKKDVIEGHIRRWRDAQYEVDQTFLGNVEAEAEDCL